EAARRSLAAALVELRATADAASGEWWQRALPQERVVLAEQSGHRTLAAAVRHQGLGPVVGFPSAPRHQARPLAAPGDDGNPTTGPGPSARARTTEDTRP